MHYVIGPDTIEALRWAEGLPNSDSAVYAKQAAFIGFLLNVAFIAVRSSAKTDDCDHAVPASRISSCCKPRVARSCQI
jgi:hypothetical protein